VDKAECDEEQTVFDFEVGKFLPSDWLNFGEPEALHLASFGAVRYISALNTSNTVSFTTVLQWEGGLSGFRDISLPSGLYYENNGEKMQLFTI
jgi:hypothetical protein